MLYSSPNVVTYTVVVSVRANVYHARRGAAGAQRLAAVLDRRGSCTREGYASGAVEFSAPCQLRPRAECRFAVHGRSHQSMLARGVP